MKCFYTSCRGEKKSATLAYAVESRLSGQDYDRGELETLSAGINNAHRLIGQLVEILADHKLISPEQLTDLIPYSWTLEE